MDTARNTRGRFVAVRGGGPQSANLIQPIFFKYRNMGARSQNACIPGRLLFKLGFIRARFCERQVTKRFYCFYSVPPRTRLQLHLDRVSSPTLCSESSLVFQQTSTIDRVTSRAANARAMPQCLPRGLAYWLLTRTVRLVRRVASSCPANPTFDAQ